MKKKRWGLWIFLILLAGGIVWYVVSRIHKDQVVLQTETPRYQPVSTTITATGTIDPVDTVAVGTQISGTVKAVYVDFNSVVKQGELIAEIDKSLLSAQVAQITASLQQAKDNQVYQQQNINRQKQLYQAGAISQADYETAQNTFNTAKDQVNSQTALLASAKQSLAYCDIYSPIDGTVLSRNVSVGQTVAASFSTPTLFSIAKDLTKMQVRASVDEADIGNVKAGQRAVFTVDAFPSDQFNGTVEEVRLEPVVSSNVVTYVTIINAPNNNLKLKPGMTANITIYTQEIPNALTVSARAARFSPDSVVQKKYRIVPLPGMQATTPVLSLAARTASGHKPHTKGGSADSSSQTTTGYVWLLRDSSLVERAIRVGIQDNIMTQVISGLGPLDLVVNGYQVVKTSQVQTGSNAGSPFLPHRPGRGAPPKAKPSPGG
ncbi:MAG TPA: efflux RND transporter periplasmic adaptor subunit [Chitinophagaceae bacterium]|nr:efflux RND transporter periplasmic adaptor subunit [Chitinophagaceae bacterium]